MERKTLSAQERLELKKGASGRLRRSGKIPAVLYGHSGTSPITIDNREFSHKFKQISENTIINLQVGEKAYDVLVKDFQEDILKGRITHIDFYEIERGKVLRAKVPVHIRGSAPGVREGGILETLSHELEVECLPKDLPESIDVDISGLEIGMSIHVSDLELAEELKILTSPDQVVALVGQKGEEILEPETEEGLEEGMEGLEAEGEAGEGEDASAEGEEE